MGLMCQTFCVYFITLQFNLKKYWNAVNKIFSQNLSKKYFADFFLCLKFAFIGSMNFHTLHLKYNQYVLVLFKNSFDYVFFTRPLYFLGSYNPFSELKMLLFILIQFNSILFYFLFKIQTDGYLKALPV